MFCLCSYRLLRPIHLVPSCSTAQSLWPRVLWHSLLFILQRTPVMLDLMFNNNHTNFYCDKKTFMCSSPPTRSLRGSVENANRNMSRVFCSPQPDKLSATLVLWLCFLLILVIHNVPNTIFDIIFKESNECKFLILQAMCSCSGKWEGNG